MTTVTYGLFFATPFQQLNNVVAEYDEMNPTLAAFGDGSWYTVFSQPAGPFVEKGNYYSIIRNYDGSVRVENDNALSDGSVVVGGVAASSLADGNVVVTWQAQWDATGTHLIYMSVIGPHGEVLVPPYEVVGRFGNVLGQPDVVGLTDGGFVIVRRAMTTPGDGEGFSDGHTAAIFATVFNADGTIRKAGPFAGGFMVASTAQDQDQPSVAALNHGTFQGDFVVAYTENNHQSVYFRLYDASGDPKGREILVDNTGPINIEPQVIGLLDNSFVIAYRDFGEIGDGDITLARYSPTGVFLNSTRANLDTTGNQANPTITLLSNGYIAVGWNVDVSGLTTTAQYNNLAIFTPDTLTRVFDYQGLGVAGFSKGDGFDIAGLINGRLVVAANDYTADTNGIDVRFAELNFVRTTTGTDSSETLTGDALTDVMFGGKGSDVLLGLAGPDFLSGDSGNDTIDGGAGVDTAIYSLGYSNYTVTQNADGSFTITDKTGADGTDTLKDVELLQFSDGTQPLVTSITIRSANLGILRVATSDADAAMVAANITSAQLTLTNYLDGLIGQAQSTTVPALVNYDFFFGKTPAAAGVDFLTGFAHQIQTPAGGGFSVVNTFVNLAATEAINPASSFAASYGVAPVPNEQVFFNAVYNQLFGHPPTSAATTNYFQTQTFNLPNGTTITGTAFDFYREYVRESLPAAQQTAANLENGARGAVVGTLLFFAEADPTTQYAQATKHFLQDAAVETPTYQVSLIGTYLASSTPHLT